MGSCEQCNKFPTSFKYVEILTNTSNTVLSRQTYLSGAPLTTCNVMNKINVRVTDFALSL